MVLKITSIFSRQQRDIAEKEAKLLSRLSHPSIIKMYDTCYRAVQHQPTGKRGKKGSDDDSAGKKERPQHLILMEFCEGGHALQVMNKMLKDGTKFDLSTLIIAFGQICNAVSYLHAQRPPIVHRDLKPANFLIKGGAYKLCDFGSAVFGHIDVKTPEARNEAEEVIEKTTTQMFRAPEMVDLFSVKKLTQATDVWALGCCLYSMAFLQNCFEEGSNLAILSNNYKIPDDNPYGEGLVELIDRMLTVDVKARCDMTEVILCLSAVYSGRPLPERQVPKSSKKEKEVTEKKSTSKSSPRKKKGERVGTFRTDGQGMSANGLDTSEGSKRPNEGKKLNPNSVAARRKKSAVSNTEFSSLNSKFEENAANQNAANPDAAFSAGADTFAAFGESKSAGLVSEDDIFGTFGGGGEAAEDANAAFTKNQDFGAFADINKSPGRTKSGVARRPRRKVEGAKSDDDMCEMAAAVMNGGSSDDGRRSSGRGRPSRGVRRTASAGGSRAARRCRSKSRGRLKKAVQMHDDDDSDS